MPLLQRHLGVKISMDAARTSDWRQPRCPRSNRRPPCGHGNSKPVELPIDKRSPESCLVKGEGIGCFCLQIDDQTKVWRSSGWSDPHDSCLERPESINSLTSAEID